MCFCFVSLCAVLYKFAIKVLIECLPFARDISKGAGEKSHGKSGEAGGQSRTEG